MKWKAPRGTRDLLPDETARWHEAETRARRLLDTYGYEEIVTPIFEDTGLFVHGTGETTDIVAREMYTFEDRKGRSMTLRPEGTPGVVRACLEHNIAGAAESADVARLFYIGPFFRYERPQKGRYRQFWQIGAEAIGSGSPLLDAEMATLAVRLCESLGLADMRLLLNSIGCDNCRPAYRELLVGYLRSAAGKLCDDCVARIETNPLRALDCKKPGCKSALKDAPLPSEHLCGECEDHFAAVCAAIDAAAIPYERDPHLVRGLDYYTRTAFEVVHEGLGARAAAAGGGRYDGLVETLGGKPTPAVGFAAGFDALMILAEQAGADLTHPRAADVYVAPLSDKALGPAYATASALREAGIRARAGLSARSLKAQLRFADKAAATHVVIIGPSEMAAGTLLLRDMRSGEQAQAAPEGLVDLLLPG